MPLAKARCLVGHGAAVGASCELPWAGSAAPRPSARRHTPVDDGAVTVGSLKGPQTPASSRWLFVPPARCRERPLSQPASGFASGLTSGRPAARLLGVLHLLLRRSSPPSAVGAWLPAFRRWSTIRSVVKLVDSPVSGQAGQLSGQWSSW